MVTGVTGVTGLTGVTGVTGATFLVAFVISAEGPAEMEMFVTSPCHHGRRQVVRAAAPKTTDQRS